MLAEGEVGGAIRNLQQAVRSAPESPLLRLRLSGAFQRKAADGDAAFLKLADREMNEAIRLAPDDREVHMARIGMAVKAGRLGAVKGEYAEAASASPLARDCLAAIEGIESAAAARPAPFSLRDFARDRLRFWGAASLALVAFVLLMLLVLQTLDVEGPAVTLSDVLPCAACSSLSVLLAWDGVRAERARRAAAS